MPANLSFEQAAAVPVSAVTALQALRDHGRVKAGQHVLVIGASGGVGTFAVQIAKALGANVTGVSSTQKLDLVRSLGADHVIDYTHADITDDGQRYDVVLDIGGNRPLSRLRRVLTSDGTLVIVGGEGGGRWTGGIHRQLGAMVLSLFVRQRLGTFIAKPNRADLDALRALIEAGSVTPAVDRVIALDRVARRDPRPHRRTRPRQDRHRHLTQPPVRRWAGESPRPNVPRGETAARSLASPEEDARRVEPRDDQRDSGSADGRRTHALLLSPASDCERLRTGTAHCA